MSSDVYPREAMARAAKSHAANEDRYQPHAMARRVPPVGFAIELLLLNFTITGGGLLVRPAAAATTATKLIFIGSYKIDFDKRLVQPLASKV